MFPTLFTVRRNGNVFKYTVALVRRLRTELAFGRVFMVLVPVTIRWHARQHDRTRRTPLYRKPLSVNR